MIRGLSDLNYLVKLSRTKEIVVHVNKMKCFRQTASRPTTEQRSTCDRAANKPESLEMYGTRFTRPDIQTTHSGETVKDVTEFDPGSEPYHNSHPELLGVEMPKYLTEEAHQMHFAPSC